MPKVTILTSLFRADDDIEPFLENLSSIDGFDLDCIVEISDISPSHRDPARVRATIADYAAAHPQIRYRSVWPDPGLYAVWNDQIRGSETPYLTMGCIDDRRNPASIAEHVAILDANPTLDVVCAATLATKVSGETWHRHSAYRTFSGSFNWQTSRVSSLGSQTRFGLDDLFRRDADGDWIDSDCLPHCMPMWRRTLHKRFGYFEEEEYGALADWEFWIRCASGGANFTLLPSIAGLYLENPNSHNRRNDTEQTKKRVIAAYRR